jgi:hypothetical protein
MGGRHVRWREAVAVTLLLALAGAAWAQEAYTVKGLRMNKVTLYKDCNMEGKGREFTREDLERSKPWVVTKDPKTSVHYWTKMDDGDYCVKAFAIETDKPVPVVQGEECGTKVAGRPLKTGAVRGVGGRCP